MDIDVSVSAMDPQRAASASTIGEVNAAGDT
jgi:hypothetical protein